jgi:hypothetical protein
MSINLLEPTPEPHGIQDDLESHLWLMIFIFLCYVPWTSNGLRSTSDTPSVISNIFEDNYKVGNKEGGGRGKITLLSNRAGIKWRGPKAIDFYQYTGVCSVFKGLLKELDNFLRAIEDEQSTGNPPDNMTFGNHDRFIEFLRAGVADAQQWPPADDWKYQGPDSTLPRGSMSLAPKKSHNQIIRDARASLRQAWSQQPTTMMVGSKRSGSTQDMDVELASQRPAKRSRGSQHS